MMTLLDVAAHEGERGGVLGSMESTMSSMSCIDCLMSWREELTLEDELVLVLHRLVRDRAAGRDEVEVMAAELGPRPRLGRRHLRCELFGERRHLQLLHMRADGDLESRRLALEARVAQLRVAVRRGEGGVRQVVPSPSRNVNRDILDLGQDVFDN